MIVITIDNTKDETVKLKEVNPSVEQPESKLQPLEAKLVFTEEVFLVPLSDIAQLVFRKAKNSTHEIICTGYKGKDGKFYGDSVNGATVTILGNKDGAPPNTQHTVDQNGEVTTRRP